MVKFIGEYEAKVDDKGRLVVPSAFKSAMTRDLEGRAAGTVAATSQNGGRAAHSAAGTAAGATAGAQAREAYEATAAGATARAQAGEAYEATAAGAAASAPAEQAGAAHWAEEKAEGPEVSFVIKKDLFAECLEMFPYDEWEKESEQVKNRLNFFNKEHAMFWREYMKNRALVTADAKFGRILIPKKILSSIGIKKDVVFAGNDHKIEIWAKESYGKEKMSNTDFISLTEKILG